MAELERFENAKIFPLKNYTNFLIIMLFLYELYLKFFPFEFNEIENRFSVSLYNTRNYKIN